MTELDTRTHSSLTLGESVPEYVNLLAAVWRRKLWLVVALLLAWAAGAIAYFYLPKTFESEAKLLVMRKSLDVRPSNTGPTERMRGNPAIHEQVLASPAVIGRAVEKYDLLSLASLRDTARPLEKIAKSLRTERETANPYENQDALFTLAYRATSADDPPKILAALLATFEDLLNEIEHEHRAAAKPILTKWRDQVAVELSAKEDAYRRMQHIPAHLDAADVASLDVPQARLARLETQKQEWSVRRTQIQRQLAILREAEQQGIDAALLAELEARWAPQLGGQNPLNDSLAFLLSKEQELVAQYGPRHPSVLAIREQLGNVRPEGSLATAPAESPGAAPQQSDPKRTVEVHVAALEKELEVATAVERVLEGSLEEARSQVSEAARIAQQAELLRAEITQLRQLHRDLVNQLEVADFERGTEYFATRMLAAPGTARRVSPSAMLLAVVSTALGGCGGLLLALLRDGLDRRIRTADRTERIMGRPILGQIPRLRGRRRGRSDRLRPLHPHLVMVHQPASAAAEALRSTLWATLCLADRTGGLQTLQVSGAERGVGTSVVAANLALAAVETGRRVLLIDANLRAPRQHILFGLGQRGGLESLLDGSAEFDQVVGETAVRGLSVVTASAADINPTALLYSPAFREMLETATRDFDLVVIDTAPPLEATDTYVIARQVDGVLVVVEPRTRWPQAQQCRRVLTSLDAPLLGVVMARAPRRASRDFQPLASLPVDTLAHHRLSRKPEPVRAPDGMPSRPISRSPVQEPLEPSGSSTP